MQVRLNGFTLVSCFSQNKDELVIEFNNAHNSFFIKASLQSQFCCLSFPREFHRARKNSIDLFEAAVLKKITAIRSYENERSFAILLDEGFSLIFKMHGNRSNILLADGNGVKSIFRSHLADDFKLDVYHLDRAIDWGKDSFLSQKENWKKNYFTLGKEVWNYLEAKGINNLPAEEQWSLFQSTIQILENPIYRINKKRELPQFSLLPSGTSEKEFTDPISAVTEFYFDYVSAQAFHSEKTNLVRKLKEKIEGGKQYLNKTTAKLNEIQLDHHYQEWADLLMAHLHEVKQGMELITLPSFYTQEPINIRLKKELNAQRNAEVFYRKAKNQQIEIDQLTKSIAIKEREIQNLQEALNQIESAPANKTLQTLGEQFELTKKLTKKSENKAYHEFEHMGFRIWVGRNAEANDELTLKLAHKEDLWLHAKDVAGSHVIVKYQSGKKFPKEVIERAAQLAAFNSKRKTDSLCPVAFTLKKYVRKRKGDPAGLVVVEKEDVVMVEPKL